MAAIPCFSPAAVLLYFVLVGEFFLFEGTSSGTTHVPLLDFLQAGCAAVT